MDPKICINVRTVVNPEKVTILPSLVQGHDALWERDTTDFLRFVGLIDRGTLGRVLFPTESWGEELCLFCTAIFGTATGEHRPHLRVV
jgi:hypothetical protein